MSALQNLIPYIYHEKQEAGSMMCAQHALNSLLQGNYFTPEDLSSIAHELDVEEAGFDDENTGQSTNMDDTGFFSVQVLLRALAVWGLDIVGWRGEAMRPYQDIPYTQLAFILNLQEHWYTLRRFGPASSKLEEDQGLGHWFSLNSLEPAPQWIGKTFLEMQIQQAEDNGYSVFAVVQRDPEAELGLARGEPDRIAATIPEDATASSDTNAGPSFGGDVGGGFEDEDYDLQAALQASMMDSSGSDAPAISPPLGRRSLLPLPSGFDIAHGSGSGLHTPLFQPHSEGGDEEIEEEEPIDPVAASMARNQRMLQQMTAEQQFAHRELASQGFTPGNQTDDYDEQLRRAIAESEAMARTSGSSSREQGHDDEFDMDTGEDTNETPIFAPPRAPSPALGTFIRGGDRVYDDDDAELQAALKASLEHVPEGWAPPPDFPAPARPTVPVSSSSAPPPTARDDFDTESVMSDDMTPSSPNPAHAPVEAAVDVDEMRRRRLARFGG